MDKPLKDHVIVMSRQPLKHRSDVAEAFVKPDGELPSSASGLLRAQTKLPFRDGNVALEQVFESWFSVRGSVEQRKAMSSRSRSG